MRKDKGLTGDLDRLPMLTWIMFLKFLDDLERVRQDEATLEARPFRETLSSPYRWRDWNPATAHSSDDDGLHNAMTGDALIAFIAQDEAIRPDGQRGPGLFAHLRSLEGSSETIDRRDVIASVFRGTVNRMQSGYILRDVLDKVNEIHFASSDETHTLSLMYESMLREMRDAAKNSGEFYTPRPLVQMIVQAVNPVLGETILDPAAGTGGFLVESYAHLLPTCQTIDDIATLQGETLLGIEAKPLPYLLCQMNLLLHGVEAPQIDPLNALRFRLSEIGDRERVDVILTNPPFGGEEEVGIQGNFPEDRRTAETALLFLQLVMRKLKRPGKGSPTGGRAGVVVPNSTLSEEGIAGRIKQDLLEDFNLHTIVRLPDGVFAPYTLIPTNVLFFDRSGPTDEVWFYEHPVPDGRRSYSKTRPLEFAEFGPFFEWLADPHENERAWKVSSQRIRDNGFKLDFRNPNRHAGLEDLPPGTLLAEASRLEENIRGYITATGRAVEDIAAVGRDETERTALGWSRVPLSEVLTPNRDEVTVEQVSSTRTSASSTSAAESSRSRTSTALVPRHQRCTGSGADSSSTAGCSHSKAHTEQCRPSSTATSSPTSSRSSTSMRTAQPQSSSRCPFGRGQSGRASRSRAADSVIADRESTPAICWLSRSGCLR
jgi:type I restriction enzyme M protein